jgi:hypothetical protein
MLTDPIYKVVNSEDLTDEQIWTICLAMMPGLRDDRRASMKRARIINLQRVLFDDARLGLTVDGLDDLIDYLTRDGEHELASLMRKWRQQRQTLN